MAGIRRIGRGVVPGVRAIDRSPRACRWCLQVEEQLRELRQHLAATGHNVAFSPGPNPYSNVEDELRMAGDGAQRRCRGRLSGGLVAIRRSDW